jgi:acetyltransferase-like isoleucine patch superfamily enzyme
MRELKRIKTPVGKSSEAWKKEKSQLKVMKNWLCAWLASRLPFGKYWFYKRMGISLGKGVQIMPDVRMEIFFPELISIADNVIIGQEVFFACHEFTVNEFKYGKISVGKNVLIGARAFILPGVTIGDNAIVAANVTIYKDVPDNTLAYGNPLQFKKFKFKK